MFLHHYMHTPSSVAQSCLTLCDPMDGSTPGFPCPSPTPGVCSNSCPLSQWCHPTISFSVVPFFSCPHSFPASLSFPRSQIFAWWWPKYWSFSFSPSNEYLGLIFFRINWFYLLAVQETLKSLLQHHSSKASVLWHSAFLWSNSYIRTWLLEKP